MATRLGILIAAGFTALLGGLEPASAQEYYGKNKVNYFDYDPYFIESEHFTIYFDKGSIQVAEFVAKEAERALVKLEKDLKYTLKGRYPIVVYNSHNGFSENNIQLSEIPEGTGGFTEFAQGRVVIPYTGSYSDFRHVIHHELSHSITIELWTGGGWLGAMVNQAATLPPLWVAEGLAEYLAHPGGMEKETDDFMRDATITGYVPPIEELGGFFAYRGGQSVFYFIAQEYGKDKVAQFVSSIRTAGNVDKALKSSLGKPLDEVNEAWQRWLKRQYWNEINLHDDPEEVAKNMTDHRETGSTYNVAPSFSPQGDKIAYLTNRRNTFDIYLMSAIDGKNLGRLVAGERSTDFESMFVLRPGISWSPDGRRIAFAAKANNKNTLYLMNVREKKVTRRFKFDLDGLFEPTWSPDGKRVAVVGLKDGWSDIYVINLEDDALHRITSDPYDEKHLDWSPDGEWIAISSDRPSVSLVFDEGKDFTFGQYDIFLIRPDGSEMRRVTSSEASDIDPSWGPDAEKLAFVSDRTGVKNIFVMGLADSSFYPVSNLLSGAKYLDWSADGKKMAFTVFHKGGFDVFLLKQPLEKRKKLEDLPLTRFAKRRKGIEDKSFVELQRAQEKAQEPERTQQERGPEQETPKPEEAREVAPDTALVERKIEKWVSDQMLLAAAESEDHQEADKQKKADADSGRVQEKPQTSLRDWNKEFQIHKYRIQFKPELFSANAGFDTFYGVSSLVSLSLSDVLGDHRLLIQTGLSFSLKDSDLFLTYANLKRQTNYYAQVFHTRLFFFSNNDLNADRYYGLALGVERPFNRFSRFEGGTRLITISRERLDRFENRFVRGGFVGGTTRGSDGTPIATERAFISEVALVDDSTMWGLYGPIDGRRARISFEGSPVGMKYGTVRVDYRKYFRVLQEYSFGLRIAGGTSFGRNKQIFYVGGVNNPINPRFSTSADVDPNRIGFSSFVWPLRGVELFDLAGDTFLLANAAFRFPLFRQLAMGWPLPFFFQNVQGELFFDIGSAFYRKEFEAWERRDGGFELRDLKAGYGLGARVNLGIFLFRYDLAWPTNLAETSRPLQYFSVDFTGLF